MGQIFVAHPYALIQSIIHSVILQNLTSKSKYLSSPTNSISLNHNRSGYLHNMAFLAVMLFRNSFGAENENVFKSVLIIEPIQPGSQPNNFNSDLFYDAYQLQNIVVTANHELERIWKEAASA
jgi:hypothetical protein